MLNEKDKNVLSLHIVRGLKDQLKDMEKLRLSVVPKPKVNDRASIHQFLDANFLDELEKKELETLKNE